MLSSLSNFLFNTAVAPLEDVTNLRNNTDYQTKELEDDWLLVNAPGDEVEESNSSDFSETDLPNSRSPSPKSKSYRKNQVVGRSRNPTLKLYVPVSLTPENPSSPPSSPNQQMDGSWYVTPPPCFTARMGPVLLETSPMENLLIEHPSMSVYGPISNFSLLQGGRNSVSNDSSPVRMDGSEVWVSHTPRLPSLDRNERRERHSVQRVQHHRTSPVNLDAVALDERRIMIHSRSYQQQRDQRKMKPSYMERQNLARQNQSTKRQRNHQLLKQPIKFCNKRC